MLLNSSLTGRRTPPPPPPYSHSHFIPRIACSLQKPDPSSSSDSTSLTRRHFVSQTATATLSLSLCISTFFEQQPAYSAEEALSAWERVYLPTDPGVVLLDIAFVPDDESHGLSLFYYVY